MAHFLKKNTIEVFLQSRLGDCEQQQKEVLQKWANPNPASFSFFVVFSNTNCNFYNK